MDHKMSDILIGQGHVHHSRKGQIRNSFNYPTFFFQFHCEKESEINLILKKKFWKLLAVSAKDYLNGANGTIDENIKLFLSKHCQYEANEVILHTMPKMFGYGFNPVSFWICKKNNSLDAVLVEVHNTFNERHFYWIHANQNMNKEKWIRSEKVFHVSPFFPVDGYYMFRFQFLDLKTRIDINYFDNNDELKLSTWVSGKLSDLESTNLLKIVFKYGWISLFVIFRIHFQALKLFLKKLKIHSKPKSPTKKVTS
jgi:uncharacterized protein